MVMEFRGPFDIQARAAFNATGALKSDYVLALTAWPMCLRANACLNCHFFT